MDITTAISDLIFDSPKRIFKKGQVTVISYSPDQVSLKNQVLMSLAVKCHHQHWYWPCGRITLLTETRTSDEAWKQFYEIIGKRNLPIHIWAHPNITDDFEIEKWYEYIAALIIPSEYVFMDLNQVPTLNPRHYKHHRVIVFVPEKQ